MVWGTPRGGEYLSKELRDLVLLVQLQEIYSSISEAIAERNSPPEEIRELQEANRLRQEELEAMERQMVTHEKEIAEARAKQAEWELELQHFQKQKSTVSNEREFTAVISEIDYATKAIDEATSRRKALEEMIEQIQNEVAERRNARPEEEGAHKEVVEAWETRKTELLKIVHDLSEKAKKVEADIQPKQRARFMRLLESKQGKALSAVVDGSCSLCHFALRPHLQQRVRRSDEIIDCEHCHRILYVEEVLVAWSADPVDG
jgi:predicted  nucleic acid-binding Zn-ribbon protein